MSDDQPYLLDNRQPEAGVRFVALAALFDQAATFRHLDRLGVAAGWRCWEVGAGGASVPAWLAERVGASGYVLATDIDLSWLDTSGGSGYQVRRHDIATDPAPGEFDLVHTRLVLTHVPRRAEALRSLVGALRPGGWLLLEEPDPGLQPLACPDEYGPAQQLANRVRHGFRTLLAQRGADLAFGRTLPRLLRAAGLTDVGADCYLPVSGPACDQLETATVRQVGQRLVDADLASWAEIDEHLGNIATGELDLATAPLVSAWGRRPPETGQR